MNAKNVLKTASLLLNLTDDFTPILDDDAETTATQDATQEFNLLLDCLNLTISEIASDYIPVVTCEKLPIVENKISFTDFTKQPLEIQSIRLLNGKTISYKLLHDGIRLNYNNIYVDVYYSYLPADVALTTSSNLFYGKVSDKCLALGTASEYCYIKGFYEEAQMWHERFKEALRVATRKKSEIKLPKRRWL